MKIDGWLSTAAEAVPEHVALIAGDESITYGELDRRAREAARRLAGLGVRREDRVALALEPSADYVVLLHALVKLGAVAAPVDPRLTDSERDGLLEGLEPRLVLGDPAEALEAPPAADVELDETTETDAVHCVIHTSGSAGPPKPVELTYGNQMWNAIGSGVRIGVAPTDLWLCCLPLHHIGGLAIVMRSALYRTGILLERFEPGAHRRAPLRAPGHDHLARPDHAEPPARRGSRRRGVALPPARRRAGAAGADRPRARGGRTGDAHLWPHRGRIPGRDHVPRRGAEQARLGGTADPDDGGADRRRRRDLRAGPERGAESRGRGGLAAHERRRPARRRRLSVRARPRGRGDRERRRERLARGGRGRAARTPGGRRTPASRRRRTPSGSRRWSPASCWATGAR